VGSPNSVLKSCSNCPTVSRSPGSAWRATSLPSSTFRRLATGLCSFPLIHSYSDLAHPFILGADGRLTEEIHRVARAVLEGISTIREVTSEAIQSRTTGNHTWRASLELGAAEHIPARVAPPSGLLTLRGNSQALVGDGEIGRHRVWRPCSDGDRRSQERLRTSDRVVVGAERPLSCTRTDAFVGSVPPGQPTENGTAFGHACTPRYASELEFFGALVSVTVPDAVGIWYFTTRFSFGALTARTAKASGT